MATAARTAASVGLEGVWSNTAHAHALAFLGQAAAGAVVDLDLGQVQDAGHAGVSGGVLETRKYACAP
jgi:hypothetical protein